jgi:hypothetical protein
MKTKVKIFQFDMVDIVTGGTSFKGVVFCAYGGL